MAEVEVFTPIGVLVGSTPGIPLGNDGPDLTGPLELEAVRWYPLDGSTPTQHASTAVEPDDILVIVTPAPEVTVHMTWHRLGMDVGPYRVTGEFATHPGFDPEKSIARPSGSFVELRDVTIEVRGDAAIARRRHVHVNRYAVDEVSSDIILAHFFPGARLVEAEAAPVA